MMTSMDESDRSQSPRALCSKGYHTSDHVWVNTERHRALLPPLSRSLELDELARQHAQDMAENGETFRFYHTGSDIKENTMKGTSIHSVHMLLMCFDGEEKSNILNPSFREMGVGTARGKNDNFLYVCQLFA